MPATQTPPTRRGQEMRQRLLDAAAGVFAEHGYHAARITDITSAAGTAQGNFYRHFENKDEVLLAVLGPLLDELLERMGPPSGRSTPVTADDLVAWNTAYLQTYARHRRLYRVMREAAAAGDGGGFAVLCKQQRQRFVKRVRSWVAELDRDGRLQGVGPPELVAESLVSMLEQISYVHVGLVDRDPTPGRVAELGRVTGGLWHRSLFGLPAG